MNFLNTKEKIKTLHLGGIFVIAYLIFATSAAYAATFPPIPESPETYTNKTSNYNPNYEYCLYEVYSQLPTLGTDPALIEIPGFSGTKEEVLEFSNYIYQYYDFTGEISVTDLLACHKLALLC